ncbi:hypothetical protein CRM22_007734 [Opisthorchis felineus]|uniref:G-protein coupled receptors family 1 profile domain-containing protein n=2 Tax=Opisthorchis felineus TaxID=147828 RepID=A0A4S2LEF3_OPIFE|nr:hypothetical protein CRM22_007734 [Opisthorchis felineus]
MNHPKILNKMEAVNRSIHNFLPIPHQNSSIPATEACVPIPWLQNVQNDYGHIHGYLAVVVCVFNIISTTINMVVLNQPSMISPTNFLLTMLALSDGALTAFYIPFSIYFQIGDRLQSATYGWSVFMIIYVNLQTLLHSASCYIVVTVAFFRVLYVRCLVRCQELCSMQRAHLAVGITFLLSGILTVPCMLSHHIVNVAANNTSASDSYMVTYVDNKALPNIMYWNSALFIKLLPLICLVVLSLIIIVTIHGKNAQMRKMAPSKRLSTMPKGSTNPPQDGTMHQNTDEENPLRKHGRSSVTLRPTDTPPTNGIQLLRHSAAQTEREKSGSRMTRMLLTIVFLFVMAHLPQAILLFLNGVLGACFTECVYQPLGDLTDLLTLMNSVVNFILYCSMSQQFRTTFLKLFCMWNNQRTHGGSLRTANLSLRPTPGV